MSSPSRYPNGDANDDDHSNHYGDGHGNQSTYRYANGNGDIDARFDRYSDGDRNGNGYTDSNSHALKTRKQGSTRSR